MLTITEINKYIYIHYNNPTATSNNKQTARSRKALLPSPYICMHAFACIYIYIGIYVTYIIYIYISDLYFCIASNKTFKKIYYCCGVCLSLFSVFCLLHRFWCIFVVLIKFKYKTRIINMRSSPQLSWSVHTPDEETESIST